MVYEVFIPISGSFLDGLVTTLYTNKYGAESEGNLFMRKIQEKCGTWKSFPLRQAIKTAVIGGAYFGFSQLDDNAKNLSPQELFSYASGIVFYGITLWNSFEYISRRRK